jgi:DnaJ like chaperone protein
MTWLGKVVGGTIGFALGGPIGAIAGVAFGHMFDGPEGQQGLTAENASPMSKGETSQMVFFTACFSMLGKLVKADGSPTEQEMASIRQFMTGDLQLNAQSRRAAEEIFQAALNSPQSFDDFARQFFDYFHDQPQLLELMVDILIRVSVADGTLHENEERLIRSAAGIFRFSDQTLQKLQSRYAPQSDKYYQILGCSRTDSDDTLKTRYRKLVRDFHPDTIAGKGLPDEFVTFAHEKFREIQEAYEMVKKERGMV